MAGVTALPLVPEDFAVPDGFRSDLFIIEPLDVRHNAADLAAWTSSIDHIRATPGFTGRTWPGRPMTLEENAADVRSWVRSDHAALDRPLHDLVGRWLAEAWPFRNPDYAAR